MILNIGLAIQMISFYTIALSRVTAALAGAQAKLELAVQTKNDEQIRQHTEIVTILQTLAGFYKEWIIEWKDVIKDFRQLLKGLGELGRPAQ